MIGRAKVRELVERVAWLEWQLRAAAREHWAMLRRLLELEGGRPRASAHEPEPDAADGVDEGYERFLIETAKSCRCCSTCPSGVPCPGCCAGGLCDGCTCREPGAYHGFDDDDDDGEREP